MDELLIDALKGVPGAPNSQLLAATLLGEQADLKADLARLGERREGPGAGLANALRGIAADQRRSGGRESVSNMMRDYFTALNAEQAQQRQDALVEADRKRLQGLQDYELKRQIDQRYATEDAPEWAQKLQATLENPELRELLFPQAVANERQLAAQEREQMQEDQAAAAMAGRAEDERLRSLDTVSRLLSNREGMASAVGTVDAIFPTIGPKAADFERDLESLGSLLTLGNLERMTGVLSESDIRLLRDAASGNLDLAQSEGRLYDVLVRAGQALAGEGEEFPFQVGGYRPPTFSEQYINPIADLFTGKTSSGVEYTVRKK